MVGPNGSGKSNVIDAMLFVFGKRAKQLRLNKVSELIHNSTDFRNLEYARVEVHFHQIVDKEGEDFEAVPDSDFVIAREAYRNNTSKYFVDKKTSNFTDVTNLLKHHGVDLNNNRFLILQGEVEQISMMKPKAANPGDEGLLEYLEDIIGTNQYVEPIEQKSKALEELNEKRTGQVNRLKLVEKEKDVHDDARQEAEAFMAKERECLRHKTVAYQMYVKDARDNVAKIAESVAELEAKLEEEKAKSTEYDKAVEELEVVVKEHAVKLNELKGELDRATKEFAEFERKDIKHREDLKNMKSRAKKLDEKVAKDTKKRDDMAKECEAIEKEVPELEAKKAELESRVEKEEATLDAMLESLKGEMAAIGAELERAQAALSPWEGKIADAKAAVDVAVTERDLLATEKEDAKRRFEEAKAGAEAAVALAKSKTEEIADAESTLESERSRAAERREAEAAAKEQERRANEMTREIRGKLAQSKSAADQAKSQSVIVQSLMTAKSKGKIKGVLGRLGDLGAIDKKYDVAVSTACAALDYIVVETTADAQACVAHLRSNNLGVATFLILEKQRSLEGKMREAKKTSAPASGAPRLIDLIKPAEPRLEVAFYYGVRDTAVADDLDAASKIAYGGNVRRRVVTLQGQLIETSGTMSGGGSKPRGGRMRTGTAAPDLDGEGAESAAAVAQAEADLKKASVTYEEAHKAAVSAGKEAKDAEAAVAKLERSLPKLRAEVIAAEERAADLEGRLGELEAAAKVTKEDAAELKRLEKAVADAKALYEKVVADAAGVRAECEALQAKMDAVGGEKLKKQKALVKDLAAGIAAAGDAATEKRATAASHAKATARLEKAIEEAVAERAKLSEDVKTIKAEFAALEEGAMAVLESQKELQGLVNVKSAECAAASKARDAAVKEMAALKHVEVDIQSKLEDLDAQSKENDDKAKHWDKELNKLRKEQESLHAECEVPVPELLTPEQLDTVDAADEMRRAGALEEELKEMKPDMSSIEAYRVKMGEYDERNDELKSVTEQRDETRAQFDELRKKRLDEFMAGFNVISLRLKEMYQMITLGGDAELELVDSMDPFAEGIVFSVRPPKKSWKNIANLSGGEKTLSSLALVFALHHYKPTPLYVMDEIDAALDFKNVSIVGHYIKERTKDAQFVIISLRNNMFELADRLVGIYKTNNTTKTVAINPGAFAVGADNGSAKKAADASTAGDEENRAPNAIAA